MNEFMWELFEYTCLTEEDLTAEQFARVKNYYRRGKSAEECAIDLFPDYYVPVKGCE